MIVKRENFQLPRWLGIALLVMVVAALLFLFSMMAFGQGILPPLPPTNHVVLATNLPPRPVVARTNIVLTWAPYTDAWFQVYSSTNGTTWQHTTNVPIWATSWTTPVDPTVPMQLFRLSAVMNAVMVTNSP